MNVARVVATRPTLHPVEEVVVTTLFVQYFWGHVSGPETVALVGELDGALVGERDGLLEGRPVGDNVGALDGFLVGDAVGPPVVGLDVGLDVGLAVDGGNVG